jgi:hypothetical protein
MGKSSEQNVTNDAAKAATRKIGCGGNTPALLTYVGYKAASMPILDATATRPAPLRAAQGDEDVMNQEPGAYTS